MNEVRRFVAEQWADGVAEAIAATLREAIAARGLATLMLAGGSTPAPVYRALVGKDVDWSRVHFFWGDERDVPPDDAESNFRMARETLLEPLGIGAQDARVHRIPTEETPDADADLYEQNLRFFFKLGPGERPHFDLILLGMGEDGHTASLFPGTAAVEEKKRLVVANPVPALQQTRITVTFPLINAARAIFVLVRGAGKAERLRAVLEGPPNRYPIQEVGPQDGGLVWMVDEAAGGVVSSQ
jgi:6-phosphogluconolactonase